MHDSKIFTDKTILITGGTGSFGQAFTKKLLTENLCKKVIIFSRDEMKQWEMKHSSPIFSHPKIRYFLGDVRDHRRLVRAFNGVDFVVHAAALKQVPAAEYNPSEFIYTNILGGVNVIDAAIDAGVEKVIALSTDKAVNPINLYGATKLCSDKLFISANAYVGAKEKPLISVVRYGNVAESRGSIIPLWRKMIAEGASSLPITDSRMTRFWLTLQEAVEMVAFAFATMQGEEIYVPKIPSIRIADLADALAPNLSKHYSGIREGEKLHELMISSDDARHAFDMGEYYLILPEVYAHDPQKHEKILAGRQGEKVPDGFAYTSNHNEKWLSVKDLQVMV